MTNKLFTNKHRDCLSSRDVANALDNIHRDFVVVPIDVTGTFDLACKRFYASVITTELGLNSKSSKDTYNNVGGLSANDIIDKNIRDLKMKFGNDKISIENDRLPNIYWLPKMHKNPTKGRFFIASRESSIKPLPRTITSIFFSFLDKCQCRLVTGVKTFWVVQNDKPVIDARNGVNKRRKGTSVSTFEFSTLYIKFPHNKYLMVLNSLIDFCFDGRESKYITVNNYGARWVKNVKDNVMIISILRNYSSVKKILTSKTVF